MVKLPDLPEKGDVGDWLKRGGTKEELLALADSTLEWTAPTIQEQAITAEKEGKPNPSSLLP